MAAILLGLNVLISSISFRVAPLAVGNHMIAYPINIETVLKNMGKDVT